jgi:hypothetical protein
MIVARLYAVDRADFLYLQHETGMNKGTLSSRISRLEEAQYLEMAFEQYGSDLEQAL